MTWSLLFSTETMCLSSLAAKTSDCQKLSVHGYVRFHVNFMSLSHPFYDMLTHGHF